MGRQRAGCNAGTLTARGLNDLTREAMCRQRAGSNAGTLMARGLGGSCREGFGAF